jgi:hypothetical protein
MRETYKATDTSRRAADANVVLSTLGRESLGVLSGNTSRIEQVVEVTVLELVRALFAVVQSRVPRDLVGSSAADCEGSLHDDLVDITPERAEIEDVLAADVDPGGVDAVVVGVGWDTD